MAFAVNSRQSPNDVISMLAGMLLVSVLITIIAGSIFGVEAAGLTPFLRLLLQLLLLLRLTNGFFPSPW